MTSLILILASLFLATGFGVLVSYESRTGVRFFGVYRKQLDVRVERVSFILTHIDFAAFVREEGKHLITRVGHDVVHVVLQSVRAVERLLTRVVRALRARREQREEAPRETSRAFVKTLSEFKGDLETNRPKDIGKVPE